MNDEAVTDFFISYTAADAGWAKWIAVELRHAGYTTFVQVFDIRPGSDFMHKMQFAAERAERTIAILSPDYRQSAFGESEWRVAFAADPTGEHGKLLPVRVRPVDPPGLLRTRVFIDLVGLTESEARDRLLAGVVTEPEYPTTVEFPGAPDPAEQDVGNAAALQIAGGPAHATHNEAFPGAAGPPASPPDWTRVTAPVLDADGAAHGTALLVGHDVVLTSSDVLDRAGDPAFVEVAGKRRDVLEVDRDEWLGLGLVRVAGSAPATVTMAYEDVNVRGRAVVVHGHGDHGSDPTSAVVAFSETRRFHEQTVRILKLDAALPDSAAGRAVMDVGTSAVIGVVQAADDTPVVVPFSEIARRWPALAQDNPAHLRRYDTVATHLPGSLVQSGWDEFDPQHLHYVVVTSEHAVDDGPDVLPDLVRDVFASESAKEVWNSFRQAAEALPPLSGARDVPESYAWASLHRATFSVLDASDSHRSLKLASRLIIEADLAVFDVTHFEPGVMFLLGIRAATRRGVTIVSHGGGWRSGEPLDRPFNLSNLSLASHTPVDSPTGDDPRVPRMARRISTGFDELAVRPLYSDLPAYDALRELGPSGDARSTIPFEDEVLVLCSYDGKHFANWTSIRSRVKQAMAARGIITKKVVRLQDVENPQLVSLSLYEQIRRCAACIADWTYSSPSTFFELGVRIAASEWGVVQLVSTSWIAEVAGGSSSHRRQFERMLILFNPIQYGGTPDDVVGSDVAARLVDFRERPELRGQYGLRKVAAEALARVETKLLDVATALRQEADTLHHPQQIQHNIPRALFYELPDIKLDQERAALERRISAWLYLDVRQGAGSLDADDPRHRAWVDIGRQVAAELFKSGLDADLDLAGEISEKIA